MQTKNQLIYLEDVLKLKHPDSFELVLLFWSILYFHSLTVHRKCVSAP